LAELLSQKGNNLLIAERGLISYIYRIIETAYGINAIFNYIWTVFNVQMQNTGIQ
jgi:hypothetical protein